MQQYILLSDQIQVTNVIFPYQDPHSQGGVDRATFDLLPINAERGD